MTPPIFQAVNVSAVQALLGTNPLRFYAFGKAPQNVIYPYAVWRLVNGNTENYLADRSDMDTPTVQIDVYASQSQGSAVARNIAETLRSAVEGHAYIVGWRGEDQDPDTKSFHVSFDVDWHVPR